MNARMLLDQLALAGVELHVDGSNLVAIPADRLTDMHRASIISLKPELLALLQRKATHRLWRVRYPDGRELSVSRSPPATVAEMRADYPGADVALEPDRDADRPLSRDAMAIANAYLDHIGETDSDLRREYLTELARDPDRLAQCFRAAVDAGLASWPSAA